MTISKPQAELYALLRKIFPHAKINHKMSTGNQVDVLIPSLNLIIEYDGIMFHKDIDKDTKRDNAHFMAGYSTIRIREEGLPLLPVIDNCYYLTRERKESLESVLYKIFIILLLYFKDVNKDSISDTLLVSTKKDYVPEPAEELGLIYHFIYFVYANKSDCVNRVATSGQIGVPQSVYQRFHVHCLYNKLWEKSLNADFGRAICGEGLVARYNKNIKIEGTCMRMILINVVAAEKYFNIPVSAWQ
ncbi:hypothetical protein D3C78_20080 [compost metagenome]